MKDENQITISSNMLSKVKTYTGDEIYFIENYIWPSVKVPGRRDRSGDKTEGECMYANGKLTMDYASPEGVDVAAAYDTFVKYVQSVEQPIRVRLDQFRDSAAAFQTNLDMTIHALGLKEEEELES